MRIVDYDKYNKRLAGMVPNQRLRWALNRYPNGVIASSFGPTTIVLMDMFYEKLNVPIPIIFLDTLHHFDETLQLMARLERRYQLHLEIYRPPEAATREEFESIYGERLWERDIEKFHEVTKLRQCRHALQEREMWITGLRRDQSEARGSIPFLERDPQHNLTKFNPLADWNRVRVFAYLRAGDIPYNPLHDRGYLSIGDEPLTDPVQENEHQRTGRWRGLAKTECGLHG